MLFHKLGGRDSSLAAWLASNMITAYLIGMLMVDLQFDMSYDRDVLQIYYCSLTKSLLSPVGLIRLFLPMFLSAIVNVLLFFKANSRTSQSLVILLLVLVGLPTMGVSVATCHSACLTGFDQESLGLVFAAHWVMLALFACVPAIQCRLKQN